MAAKKKAAKAGAAVMAAKNSPYVQRVIADEDLRDNIMQAYTSAHSAYARLTNRRVPTTKQIFEDKKLQKQIQQAAAAFKEASVALHEAPKKQGGGGGGGIFRKLLLLLLVVGGAFALSEGLRKKALDALFGAEEEFEYTSATTPPASPTPASPTPAAPAPSPTTSSATVAPASSTTGVTDVPPSSPATP